MGCNPGGPPTYFLGYESYHGLEVEGKLDQDPLSWEPGMDPSKTAFDSLVQRQKQGIGPLGGSRICACPTK